MLAAQTLTPYAFDLPFVRLYAVEDDGRIARLVAPSGNTDPADVPPITLGSPADHWALSNVVQTSAVQIREGVTDLLEATERGPFDEPPDRAVIFPVTLPRAVRPGCHRDRWRERTPAPQRCVSRVLRFPAERPRDRGHRGPCVRGRAETSRGAAGTRSSEDGLFLQYQLRVPDATHAVTTDRHARVHRT
jgi:hypothetical protein